MTKVWCDRDDCTYWKMHQCTKDEIAWIDGDCETYDDYTETSPEYQNVFYLHVRSKEDGKQYRQMMKGKKYEFFGHTFYTQWDDRDGISGIVFTEEKSGYAVPGSAFVEKDPEKLEKIKAAIERNIANCIPVIEFEDIPEDQLRALYED